MSPLSPVRVQALPYKPTGQILVGFGQLTEGKDLANTCLHIVLAFFLIRLVLSNMVFFE